MIVFGRHRHAYLLASLALLLLVSPFLTRRIAGIVLVEALLSVTLIASVLTAAATRRQLVTGFVLAASAQVALLLQQLGSEPALAPAPPLLGLAFFVYITSLMLRRIFLETRSVTIETICAALSVYLFLGLAWVFAYSLLEVMEPQSFSFGSGAEVCADFSRFIGFSFVTLTTLGYGNIFPANARADALAYTEAVVGQIYLAVLVARLVALQLTQSPRDEQSG